MQTNSLRREHPRDFIQVLLRTEVRKPSDTMVLEHMNLRARWDMLMSGQVDAKIMSTIFSLGYEASLGDVNIIVGGPSEWSVIPVSG